MPLFGVRSSIDDSVEKCFSNAEVKSTGVCTGHTYVNGENFIRFSLKLFVTCGRETLKENGARQKF